MTEISRQEYAGLFGPTAGDKIRLGDTDLFIEVERDLRVLGDEAIYGGGKTLRDGMGVNNQITSRGGALDLVITNVTIVDALLGTGNARPLEPTMRRLLALVRRLIDYGKSLADVLCRKAEAREAAGDDTIIDLICSPPVSSAASASL